jgi:hypothetical protein
VATVEPLSPRPRIALEELDPILSDVQCGQSQIVLTFDDTYFVDELRPTFEDPDALIVTSHEGCNEDGGRAFYR